LLVSGLGSLSLKYSPGQRGKKKSVLPNNLSLKCQDTWIELDLDNMAWNLNQVRKSIKAKIMAVVKANAYGHGLIQIGRFLEKSSIDFLMVGNLEEALNLREAGIKSPLLNFGPFCPQHSEKTIQNNISQSIFSEEAVYLNRASLRLERRAKIHIHIDTGMGRMGIPFYKALPLIEKISSMKGVDIQGISTALTEDDDFDRVQIKRFLDICKKAEKKGISLGLKHAASSDGMLDMKSSWLDMVRPGICLYGYYPSEKTQKKDPLSLKPVLQLKSRVAAVKILRPGDSLSYHRKYTASKREKIAVIAAGYSDGYPPTSVNKSFVLIHGKRYPLIAAITANHSIALLREDTQVSPGDEVILIGSQEKEKITADEVAGWGETSVYKVLIGLNPLIARFESYRQSL